MPDETAVEAGKQCARLLIVDDEAAQMKALCDTLGDHGYETVGYTVAQDALAALRASKFDLFLTDLMMPGMDGIALLSTAQKIDGDLVGIVMTGHATVDTAIEAMKAGALDYIAKPFKLSVILPVISRALAVRRLRLENAALQQRVREHAAELEAINKELEAFSYSVSHDLRAPLRAVLGFSKILVEEHAKKMPPEAQRLLNQVTVSAARMGQLIEDLLRFSRLNRQTLVKQPVNVAGLINGVLAELRAGNPERSIRIEMGHLPDAVADPSLLRQVFVNLLSNAFKFTSHKDDANVEISCRQQDGENIYFVRDNGAGFDMKYVEKLFGVFQRFHSLEEFDGTGVGLSIVQRIVLRHEGRIWAEAAVNQGAAFYFTLSSR